MVAFRLVRQLRKHWQPFIRGSCGRPVSGLRNLPRIHRRQAVRSEKVRYLAAVKGVMHDEPRQDRLPRVPSEITGTLASERLAEHLWRPARHARLNDLPRALDANMSSSDCRGTSR